MNELIELLRTWIPGEGDPPPSCFGLMEEAANALLALQTQLERVETELRNIVNAKRFSKDHFEDDTAFADWAQSRARHAIPSAKTETE